MSAHKTHQELQIWLDRAQVETDERLKAYFDACVFTDPPESQAERIAHVEHNFD